MKQWSRLGEVVSSQIIINNWHIVTHSVLKAQLLLHMHESWQNDAAWFVVDAFNLLDKRSLELMLVKLDNIQTMQLGVLAGRNIRIKVRKLWQRPLILRRRRNHPWRARTTPHSCCCIQWKCSQGSTSNKLRTNHLDFRCKLSQELLWHSNLHGSSLSLPHVACFSTQKWSQQSQKCCPLAV